MRKPTIADISRETGLSRGTVSRALNDRPDISAPTRQRVLDACRQLNFVPSVAARSLATGRQHALAVLAIDFSDSLVHQIVRGALARAQAERYSVQLIELPDDGDAETRIRSLSAERIDGLIVTAALTASRTAILGESFSNHPVAACCELEGFTGDVLAPDHAEAGHLAAGALLRGRPAEILHIRRAGCAAAEAHRAGFAEAVSQAGARARYLVIGDDSGELGAQLRNASGIACADEALAISALLAIVAGGRVPGRDVALIGYGSSAFASRFRPSLAMIDPCGREIGGRAVEVLLQRIEGSRRDGREKSRIAPMLFEGRTLRG